MGLVQVLRDEGMREGIQKGIQQGKREGIHAGLLEAIELGSASDMARTGLP